MSPDIAALRDQLDAGRTSVLALVHRCLRRIAALDADGPRLNAVPVLAADALEAAGRLDAELAAGRSRGALHGIPFTVKDSFAVVGQVTAAGSPAFAGLVARADAVVVERLRAAGAVPIGRTTMPPMAIGGGQAGLHGRTRSPYNPEYLAAAWHSGSSIGSAVAVAAELCAFGLGEETVSSGRSPASNNALVAYTPSWGVVPSAGNWPLHPYRDVVVPHTRTVADLAEVLAVIAGPDPRDVWAQQRAVDVAAAAPVAERLREPLMASPLAGRVFGVPRLYIGEAGDGVEPLPIRPSILALWQRAEQALLAAGASVVHVDFPLVESYEGRRPGGPADLQEAGYLPAGWTGFELADLMTHAWQGFIDEYAAEPLPLHRIAPGSVRPDPPYSLDAVHSGRLHPGRDVFDIAGILRRDPPTAERVAEVAGPALAGLDAARRELFEDWLRQQGLDGVLFPANTGIGAWDAETNPSAAASAWADGAVFSSTNHVLRRVGIPSVTLPMGLMADTGMPVGLTLCGPAWTDAQLIATAASIERILPSRTPPSLPEVPELGLLRTAAVPPATVTITVEAVAEIRADGSVLLTGSVQVEGAATRAFAEVAGHTVALAPGTTPLQLRMDPRRRTEHGDVDVLLVVTALGADGLVAAADVQRIPFTRPDPAAPPRAIAPQGGTP